ncbi:MAG: membrane dipeptidase [Candidatus Latescibacterota bacterium]|nr:membrane dipeptidase [Candidatus Latescibacterota bacterium]
MLLFDAHLDLAMNALEWDRNLELEIKDLRALEENMSEPGRARGTTTLPEMRSGEVFLSVVTVISRTARPGLSTGTASQEISCARARGQLAYYRLLESQRKAHIITRSDQITAHKSDWENSNGENRLGFIISMEGADPIVWPEQVHEWYNLGLRQVSLSHYGVSTYSHGTGTVGGVTKSGINLLKEMEKAKIALDLTHLADKAFWEALDNFGGRVLASHNNCRRLVPNQRQFTDEQIRAIINRDGVIGSALDAWMLHPNWIRGESQPAMVSLSDVSEHIDHVCQLAGTTQHAAIGSDLDGGYGTEQTPCDLNTIADLQKLQGLLAEKGYKQKDIESIFHGNWIRFYTEILE